MIPLVYDELRRLAAFRMRSEPSELTISGTALVHEVYLRFKASKEPHRWKSQRHFIGAAAESMRRILIDRCRARSRKKRGSNREVVPLDEDQVEAPAADDRLMAIDAALDELEKVDREGAELVKMRYFVGLTMAEVASLTGTPVRSLNRQWSYVRAWMAQYLERDRSG